MSLEDNERLQVPCIEFSDHEDFFGVQCSVSFDDHIRAAMFFEFLTEGGQILGSTVTKAEHDHKEVQFCFEPQSIDHALKVAGFIQGFKSCEEHLDNTGLY